MRLKYVPYSTQADRAKMKPAVGDAVLYENTKHIVARIGLKYAYIYREDNPDKLYFTKLTNLIKWFDTGIGIIKDSKFVLPN